MNKVKMFFIAAALVLITAGVFAGKTKFAHDPQNLYYYNSGSWVEIAGGSIPAGEFDYNVAGTQLTISGGTAYKIYTFVSGGTPQYQSVVFH